MWIPKSAAEVENAAARADLEETHTFDAKKGLPPAKKNHDIAVDVDAMTVDGGSIVYGLGEDKNKRLTVLAPFGLAGAPERIAQIVETGITEPPFIRVQTLPLDIDPSKGYVLVIVPQSPRAPHQVIADGDMRYYGRGAKGNRVLSEAEVAALYERRERWEVSREELLRDELARAPEQKPELGYLVAFARPVVPDDSMVECVRKDGNELRNLLLQGAQSWGDVRADQEGTRYDPDLRRATYVRLRGAAGWTITTEHEDDGDPQYTAKLELDFDGTGHFFCGRIVDTMHDSDKRIMFDTMLAGNLASFFAAMGAFYEEAGYVGHVDVGMALTNLEGSMPTPLGRQPLLGPAAAEDCSRDGRGASRRSEGRGDDAHPALPGRHAGDVVHAVPGAADGLTRRRCLHSSPRRKPARRWKEFGKPRGQKAVTEYELSGAQTPSASQLRCRRLPPIAGGVAW